MQLETLDNVLKHKILKIFLLPYVLFLLFVGIIFIYLNFKNVKNEDLAFLDTIRTPLGNSIISFQAQESQMLLNSISKYRGFDKSYLLSNDNSVIAAYPSSENRTVGRSYNSECKSQILINHNSSTVGKVCYTRLSGYYINQSLLLILVTIIFSLVLIIVFYTNFMKSINYFMMRLTSIVNHLDDIKDINIVPVFLEEEKILISIRNKKILIDEINSNVIKNALAKERLNIAEQVSHDLRSPLSVIKNIVVNKSFNNQDYKTMTSSIERMFDIANNLLGKKNNETRSSKIENLVNLLVDIVEEKKIYIINKNFIDFNFENNLQGEYFLEADKTKFLSVISNLINNSIEAILNTGKITLIVNEVDSSTVEIKIKDSGIGIPAEMIDKIGIRGFSHGKSNSESGSGLGVSNAIEFIQEIGGSFILNSVKDNGTEIKIQLPIQKICNEDYQYVYIDNDQLFRFIWRNTSLKKKVNVLILSNINDFKKFINKINKKNTKIYIDSDLGKDEIKGEDFAKFLYDQGYENLLISTGHSADRFLHLPWLIHTDKRCPF